MKLDATRELIRKVCRGNPIKVAVTEWNTTAGDWGPGSAAKLWTLRKRAGLFTLSESSASKRRSGVHCQHFQSDHVFLFRFYPYRQPSVVIDTDILRATHLCDTSGGSQIR